MLEAKILWNQIDKEFVKHQQRAQQLVEKAKNEKNKDTKTILQNKAKEEIEKA